MLNSKFFIYLRGILVFLIITAVGMFFYQQKFMTNTLALMNQDDNQGFITFLGSDLVGAYSPAGTESNGTYIIISGTGTNGNFSISQTKPIQSSGWQNFVILGNNLNTNTIRYVQFFDCGVQPGTLGAQFATGYSTSNLNGGLMFDISTIDVNKTCFSAKINMKSSGGLKPEISKIITTFIPKPIVDMDLSGSIIDIAGNCITYTYRRSLSYVDKNQFVVYTTLPSTTNNTVSNFNQNYNQFPNYNPTYKDSSDGGIYTSSATVYNGINIPANSIYRDPTNAKEGNTYNYKFTICSIKGTQTGTNYAIKVSQATNSSIIDTNTVITTIISSPLAELNNNNPPYTNLHQYMQGGYDAGSEIQLGAASNPKIITYYYDAANGRKNQTATEDIFNPSLTIDFSGVFANLQSTCGDTDSNASKSRVVLPSGFSRVGTSAVKNIIGNIPTSKNDIGSWTVNYNDCNVANTKMDIVMTFSGDNISPLNYTYPLNIVSGNTPNNSPSQPGRAMYITQNFGSFSNLYGGEFSSSIAHIGSDYYGVFGVRLYYQATNNSLGNNMLITQIPDEFEIVDVIQGSYRMIHSRTVQAGGFIITPQPPYGPRWTNSTYTNGYMILRNGIGNGSRNPSVGYGPISTGSDDNFFYNGRYPDFGDYKFFYSSSPGSILNTYPSYSIPASSLSGALPTSIGSNWTTSITAGSRWVGMYVKCIENVEDGTVRDPNSTICKYGSPVDMQIIVKPRNKYTCGSNSPILTSSSRLFYDYRSNTTQNRDQDFAYQPGEVGGLVNGGGIDGGNGTVSIASWDNQLTITNGASSKVQIVGNGGTFSPNSVIISGIDSLNVIQTGNYVFGIKNGSGATMSNINLTISIGSVNINGSPVYPNVSVNPSVGTIVSQTPSQIILSLGNISANTSLSPSINISYPAGFNDNTPVLITGDYVYDGECNKQSGSVSKSITLKSVYTSPTLSGAKFVSTGAITIDGSITYAIDLANIGTKTAKDTWIVDNIAAGTMFTEAYTAGSMQAFANFAILGTQSYNCIGCEVYFSIGSNISSSAVPKDIANTISNSGSSYNNFVLGVNNNGVWTLPTGISPSEVKRIAFNVKDVDINERNTIGFQVQNIDNIFSDTIINVAAVVSNELRAAATNQVETNILYDPSFNKFDISLEKYVHASGQPLQKSLTGIQGGSQLYFELVVKNISGQLASNITVKDILPVGFTISGDLTTVGIDGSSSSLAGYAAYDSSNRTITRSGTTLSNGDFAILTIPVVVDPLPTCGLITNSGSITSYVGQDTNLSNHTSSAEVYQCPSVFDLSIKKSVDHYYTYIGDNLTYSLSWNKTGLPTARNYTITDTLPSDLSYVSSTNGGVYDAASRTVSWTMPDLVGTTGGTYNIIAKVQTIPASYKFINNASICEIGNSSCCNSNEANCTNNSGQAANELYDLSIVKTNDGFNTSSGSLINYNIKYSLSGLARNDIRVVDILPPNVQYISSTNGGVYDPATNTVTWTGLSLSTDASANIGIVVKVISSSIYQFTNTGYVGTNIGVCVDNTCNLCLGEASCDNNISNANNIVSVDLYDLSIIKTNDKYYTKSGDTINYNIKYILSGNARSDIRVVDILPTNVQYISSSNGGVYDPTTNTVSWSNLSLATDASANLAIVVKVTSNDIYQFINTGYIGTSNGVCIDNTCNLCLGEANCDNNTSIASNGLFDLSIIKTSDKYYTKSGDTINYTLKYILAGSARSDIRIVDMLPANLQYISSSNGGVYDSTTNIVSWTGLSLPTNGSGYVYISAKVTSNNIYKFTNIGYIGTNSSVCIDNSCNLCTGEVNCTNNSDQATNELYDLSIVKTNDGFNTSSGSLINYNIKYSLSGLARNDIRVVDILPPNVQYISSTNGGVYDPITNTVTWTGLSLATDGSANLGVVVKVLTNDVYVFTSSGFIGTDTGAICIDNTCNLCNGETRCDNNQDHIPNGLYNLSVIKTSDKYYSKSGDIINYTIRYILAGLARSDIRVVDILPTNLQYISSSSGSTYDPTTNIISWNNLSLATNGSDYLYISAKVLTNNVYNFTNIAKIGISTGVCLDSTCSLCKGEANCIDNTGQAINELYDLSIIKTNDSYTTSMGSLINYNIKYILSGNARSDIRVVDILPTNVQYISSSNGGVYDPTTNTVSWTGLSLATDASANLTIVVKVTSNDIYQFTNTGYVGTNTGLCTNTGCNICQDEVNCDNNTSNASNGLFDLSIFKTSDSYYTKSGNYINYYLKYILSGLARSDIRVIDVLPTNLQFVSGSNGAIYDPITNLVTWSNLSLPTNGSGYVYIKALVLNNNIYDFTNIGYIGTSTGVACLGSGCSNNICLDSGCKNINLCIGEINCNNNSGTTSNSMYDLAIIKTVDKNKSFFDEILVYNLTYNLSGNARSDVSVIDRLPDEVDFVSASLTGYRLSSGFANLSGQYLVWSGLSMPKNGSGSITISVKIKSNSYFASRGLTINSVITNNAVVGINTGNTDTGFTYIPEINTNNNTSQATTSLRCNIDPNVSCNGGIFNPSNPPTPPVTPNPPLPGSININVCRDNTIVSINSKDLKSTDIQGNSCPKTLVCRNNTMVAINPSEKLSSDKNYCVPPYEAMPYVPPTIIPKTGVDILVSTEAFR